MGLLNDIFLWDFRIKICMYAYFSCLTSVKPISPISFSVIWPSQRISVKGTNYETLHYKCNSKTLRKCHVWKFQLCNSLRFSLGGRETAVFSVQISPFQKCAVIIHSKVELWELKLQRVNCSYITLHQRGYCTCLDLGGGNKHSKAWHLTLQQEETHLLCSICIRDVK
jgi:hypothetical protein